LHLPIRLVVFDIAGTTVQDDGVVGDCLGRALLALAEHPHTDLVDHLREVPPLCV
jgi:hypothetical protein